MSVDAAVAVVADAAAAVDAAAAMPEAANLAVVKPAFGGNVPVLPQLSRDGATVALDVSRNVGLSDMASFEVAFSSDGTKLDRIAVLSHATAAKLAENADATFDAAAMAKSGAAVTKRLTDGGFTPFAKTIEDSEFKKYQAGPDLVIPLGSAKLTVKEVSGKAGPSLQLRLDDAAGKQVTEQTIAAVRGSKRPGDCGGDPHLRSVWFDEPRKRVLLQIMFSIGGHECNEIPAAHRLWKLP